MRKDLAHAGAVYGHLRKADVTPWCPPEVASVPVIREFLRSLYLSGNGALIFANSTTDFLDGAIRSAQQAQAVHERAGIRESG
jgi:hypothetical protein